MPKSICLINLEEIKTLRITCPKCHAYWALPIEKIGDSYLVEKCFYCDTSMKRSIEDIKRLLETIKHIQDFSNEWQGSFEIEIEKKSSEKI